MERKFRITVDGRQYYVTVEDLSEVSSLPYSQAGTAYMPPPPPNWNSPEVPAAAPPVQPAVPVPADGAVVVCTLGGVVDQVLVAIGQEVGAGDRVAVIEAMKMKTPMITQRAGKVAAILVKPGDSVETGQVLVELS
ncbi:MAG: biotin/lipoyl-containing protein [Rhodomicrobium sp.]